MQKFLDDIRAGDTNAMTAAIRCTTSEMNSFGKDELLAAGLVEACLSHVSHPAVARRPPPNADMRLLSQGGATPVPILAINVLLNATAQVRVARWDAVALAHALRPLLKLMALDVRTVWGEPRIWDGCAVMALGLIRHVILHGQAAAKEALWSVGGDACLRLAACALDDEGLLQAGQAMGMRGPQDMGGTILMEWCDVGISSSTALPDAAGRATLALVAAVPCGRRLESTFAAELPRLVGRAAGHGAHGLLDSLEYAYQNLIKEGGDATGALREGAAVRELVCAAEGGVAARGALVAKPLACLLACSLGGAAGMPTDAEGEAVIGAGAVEAALRLLTAHPRDAVVEEAVADLLAGARQCALQKRTGAALRARIDRVRAAVGPLRASGASSRLLEQVAGLVEICRTVAEAVPSGAEQRQDVSRCHRCHNECSGRLKCAKCRTVYCGRECQMADWNEGDHKKECKFKRRALENGWSTTGHAARVRNKHDTFDAEAFSRAANALFWRRTTEVVYSAALQRADLFDCVVCIDMCDPAHRVRPVPVDGLHEFLDAAIGIDYKGGAGGRHWEHLQFVLERNRRDGALTALAYALTGRPPPEETHEVILKTFPAGDRMSWRQMHDDLLEHAIFQLQLASSDTHDEAVEALALGERTRGGLPLAEHRTDGGTDGESSEPWSSIPGMTPQAAAFGSAHGMTPERFAQIAQMVSEAGMGPMMEQLMRGSNSDL